MKSFEPSAVLVICNWGGIEIEINETGEAVKYRYFGKNFSKIGRRACQIQYTTAGRAFFRIRNQRYYLDEFTRI